MNTEQKVNELCELITSHQRERLVKLKYNPELHPHKAVSKDGNKYIRVDVGTSGKYMVEKSTGNIYGIKAYGVIHHGHQYGTLETINDYFWGGYTAIKRSDNHGI